MGVSPSGVDDKHLYDNISNFPFHLSVIVNNKLDFNARIATDMVINTVSVRGMDSNYISKEITDGKIIVVYSLPVSICSTDISEFEEEFNNIKYIKESKEVVNHVYKKFPKQQVIPFDDNTISTNINKYMLGTLNYKFVTLNEAVTNIITEEDAQMYLDGIESICMDYVDQGKAKKVKVVLSDLENTLENSFSEHPFINSITYGLNCIHTLVQDVEDFEEVGFGKKPPTKDISRMTDQEWKEYILNDE
jgi:hypothetical protein